MHYKAQTLRNPLWYNGFSENSPPNIFGVAIERFLSKPENIRMASPIKIRTFYAFSLFYVYAE